MTHRAALYCRVSTARQRDDDTIASQRAALFAFAAERGWAVVLAAEDEGISGTVDPLVRPGMAPVLDAIRRRDLDLLLILDISRLSRDDTGLHIPVFRSFLKAHDVRLWTLEGEFLAVSPMDQLVASVRAFVAAEERRSIRDRTVRGRQFSVANGGRPRGVNMTGYTWSAADRKLVPDPEQAALVREVFRIAIEENKGPYSISRALKVRGIKGGRKTYLYEDGVQRIIERETYYTGRYHPEPKAFPDMVREVEPLVDEETWMRANAVLEAVSRPAPERHTRYDFLIRGRVRCAHCGRAMAGQCSVGRYAYYRCGAATREELNQPRCAAKKGIRADLVDEAVWATVVRLLRDPDALRAEIERATSVEAGSEQRLRAELAQVEAELGKLQGQRKRLAGLLLQDVLTEDDVRDERARIEAASAPLTRRRDVLAGQLRSTSMGAARLAVVDERLDEIRQVLDHLTPPERAAVVAELVDVVRIDTLTGDVTVEAIVLFDADPPKGGGRGGSSGGGHGGSGFYGALDSSIKPPTAAAGPASSSRWPATPRPATP